jgi:cell division protein FtsQ
VRGKATREVKIRGGIRWRFWLGLGLAGALCVSTAMAARAVRRYALSDQQFTLSRDRADALSIGGVVHASRWKIQRVFAGDWDRSVFSVPLDERRRRLLGVDWVRDASVSRVWPDRLIVRIVERTPVARVNLPAGSQLIDEQGVLLEPPAGSRFDLPVLTGVHESESEAQRRERVRTLARVQQDLGALMQTVSEVATSDPEQVRLVVQVDRRAVELLVGGSDFGRRYRNFLSLYPEIRKRSPEVGTFDLRLDDRITAKE